MNWWEDRDDLALLARYMSRAGYTAHNVAEMISEPWHWSDEYAEALAWAEVAPGAGSNTISGVC